jgi:plastocyanin
MRWLRFAPAILVLVIPALAHAATANVDAGVGGNKFSPSTLSVGVGDTVTFTNKGGTHNVDFDDIAPLTDPTSAADLGSRQFDTAGVYPYHCDVHGTAMSGTIYVGVTPPTPTATPGTTPTPGSSPVPTSTAGGPYDPSATTTPSPVVTPDSTSTPSAATTTVALASVSRHVRHGRVRGKATVEPAGTAYTITVRSRGVRVGRTSRTATGAGQAFAVRLSKAARGRLARSHRLRVTLVARAGAVGASRTLTLR